MHRSRATFIALAVVGLALPAVALAKLTEIGNPDPQATPACPSTPCYAITRTTGYQAKVGTKRGPDVIPRDGKIVAWTVTLGKPGKKQTTFFEQHLGGEASAQITILRPGHKLHYRVVGQGDPQTLTPYFGQTAQFPLSKPLDVKKGWVVALTVPTWAPALAVQLGNDTSWRASRRKGTCDDTSTQTALTGAADLSQFYCLYRTARLTYSATLISTP
jgi:hypothetical protein